MGFSSTGAALLAACMVQASTGLPLDAGKLIMNVSLAKPLNPCINCLM